MDFLNNLLKIQPKLIDNPLDCFIIMETGCIEITSAISLLSNIKLNKYHYYPLTYQNGILRENLPSLYNQINHLGGLIENNFKQDSMQCLVIDDAIYSGRTLANIVSYLQVLGYSFKNMFVYSRDIRCNSKNWKDNSFNGDNSIILSHVSHYDKFLKSNSLKL
ncbi:MAG: hypothetical protein ACOYT4_05285 [Nanoarchaeota archaeon]